MTALDDLRKRFTDDASFGLYDGALSRRDVEAILQEVDSLESALAEAQRRAEAAVEDMWTMRSCQSCLHQPEGYPSLHGVCKDCDDEDKWEWRGPEKEKQ